ncbi:MAG TPA: hypothetical protein VH592_00055 [Gemmataceae bacterium]|jgi:hypothetical protein
MIQSFNSDKASHYMDAVQDKRQRSAVLAIHLAWLDHFASACTSECIEPTIPLDLLILYQAAAATFQDWPPHTPPQTGHASSGHVINQQQANARILSAADEEIRLLASIFAHQVIALSSTATSEQDLDYYVQLFLKCVCDKSVIRNIASGAISEHSAQLCDPDLW